MTGVKGRGAVEALEVVFLGSSGCIQVPAFFCDCATCRAARANEGLRRTRAGLAVLGSETVLIDAGPDLASQLEREQIRRVDRIFLTHWHGDHVGGLGDLGEPSTICAWPPIAVYVPSGDAHHFDQELAYLRPRLNVHPIEPGRRVELADGVWQVVKTNHTDHSVGFVVHAGRTFAYLVDGIVPPAETLERLAGCDLLIIEATMDELDEPHWKNFSVQQAVAFWQDTGIAQCILTHCSCHSWRGGKLVAGWTREQRGAFERDHPGLTFARDGMRIRP